MKMPKTMNALLFWKYSNVLIISIFLLNDTTSATFILVQNVWENKTMPGPVKQSSSEPWTIRKLHIRTEQVLN